MQDRKIAVYSNMDDIDISEIPQLVINDIANIIYADMCRKEEQENKTKMAWEREWFYVIWK